jgi:hypothetical protein
MISSPLFKTDDTEYYWIKSGETTLCNLGYKFNVDKSPIFGNHTYTPIYDKLLNDLLGSVYYEVRKNEIIFSKDVTLLGVDTVNMYLVVMDISLYSNTDPLPNSST